jgi:iron(II)-dependent oxidoreductase
MDKGQLEAQFRKIWARSETFFDGFLTRDALLVKPIELRHPFLFYVGHIAGFNYIHVNRKVCKEEPFNADYDNMFERGIDPDVMDPTKIHSHSECPKQNSDWPAYEEVKDYVQQCHEKILEAFDQTKNSTDNKWTAKLRVYHLGMEHEMMHQETLLYMYQQLDSKYKHKPNWIPAPITGPSHVQNTQIHIPAGKVTLGANFDEIEWGWDNEFSKSQVDVPAFSVDSLNVTNGEFLEFVTSGNYDNPQYWRPEDWIWKEKENMKHPVFWRQHEDGSYVVKLLFSEEIPIAQVVNWPVFVSWAEATAYAKWRGRSIISEGQYQRAAYTSPNDNSERQYPWGNEAPTPEHCNVDWNSWAPTPVGTHPKGASAWGVHDLIGDAWEWTSTPFGPLQGFEAMPHYPGYSSDFFEGKHYVIKGASFATDLKLIRPSFRNWYQDRYPFMFAKFRLVTNENIQS